MLPSVAMTLSLATASTLPTISDIFVGLYFSTCAHSADNQSVAPRRVMWMGDRSLLAAWAQAQQRYPPKATRRSGLQLRNP
jgi:hypothetical protein